MYDSCVSMLNQEWKKDSLQRWYVYVPGFHGNGDSATFFLKHYFHKGGGSCHSGIWEINISTWYEIYALIQKAYNNYITSM